MPNMTEITDLSAPELHIFSRIAEAQLLHFYEPDYGIFIAESPKVIERALDAGYVPLSLMLEKKHIDGEAKDIVNRCKDIPIYTAPSDVLTEITGFNLARGALCAMRRRALPDAVEVCRDAKRIAVLENITNPTNVGAVFRSAAALGMDAVLLTKGCSDPLYRRSARVSMGTVFQVPWTFVDDRWLDTLHENGFKSAAMALCEDTVSIDDESLMAEEKLAVVLGNEGEGLLQETIDRCDYKVCIPMSHGVDSLNAAAASAVAFWQLGVKNRG